MRSSAGVLFSILSVVLLRGAIDPTPPNAPRWFPGQSTGINDTLKVDTGRSIIAWKGTKFWGLGKHEGTIRIREGTITVNGGKPVAGRIVIDMHSIAITDMPAHETVPRNRLLRHLAGEDFFNVDNFPTATFEFSASPEANRVVVDIYGQLEMRGVRHGVRFKAALVESENDRLVAEASFTINRQDWGVAYRGSRLTNDLVDDTIHLKLSVVAGS